MPSFPTNSALSGLGAHFELLIGLTRRSCQAMRTLSELHLQCAQQLMQDTADANHRLLNCTDAFQLAAIAANAGVPAAQHLQHYQRQLFKLINGVQLDLNRNAQAGAGQHAAWTARQP